MKAIVLVDDGFEDAELLYPLHRLREAGYEVLLVGDEQGRSYRGKAGVRVKADRAAGDVSPQDYDVLVVPGGHAPDRMRTKRAFVNLVRQAFVHDKPVAAICHGPQLLIEAEVVQGRTLTAWPSVRTDLRNAGATVKDEAAVVDGRLVTARQPDDLGPWMKAFLEAIAAPPAAKGAMEGPPARAEVQAKGEEAVDEPARGRTPTRGN